MPKKTKKSENLVPTPVEISKELSDKLGSLRAITQAHNLLQQGHFPYSYKQAIEQSLIFLQALHEQVKADALADPQADLVPELKAQKEQANV